MKPSTLALVAILASFGAAAAQADTIYYSPRGGGIEAITGKVVEENGSVVKVVTKDGRTVSIPADDVYQIIRDRPPAPKPAPVAPPPAPVVPPAETVAPQAGTVAPEAGTVAPQAATAAPQAAATPVGDSLSAGGAATGSTPGSSPSESPATGAPVDESPYAEYEDSFYSQISSPGPNAPGSGRGHHFGFKGGMNIANMTVDPQEYQEDGSLKSFAIGGFWGMPLNRRFTLQTEAIYSVKGDTETAGGYTTSTHMSYIDVPVLAKIGFKHGAPAQPSLFLGPSVSLNVSANSKLEGEGADIDVDVKDQVRTVDLGLVVGGGLDFSFGRRTYGIELRYSRGLSNAAGDEANGTARNEVLAVMGSFGLQ